MCEISIVVVTFNPNIILLKKMINNLKSLNVYISDNGSDNVESIKKVVDKLTNIELILNNRNVGIATAQNRCLKKILKLNKSNFVLFLDQDSLITEDSLIKLYYDFLKYNRNKLGVLAASNSNHSNKVKGIVDVNQCISSGMMVSVNAIKQVGLMMDSLFIDMVDYEWCWRFIKNGWHVAIDYNVSFDHQIGNHKTKLNRIVIAPFRLYYVFRNTLFLICNKKLINKKYTIFWMNYLFKLFIFNIVFCDDRLIRYRFIWKGIKDGIRGKLGKLID